MLFIGELTFIVKVQVIVNQQGQTNERLETVFQYIKEINSLCIIG